MAARRTKPPSNRPPGPADIDFTDSEDLEFEIPDSLVPSSRPARSSRVDRELAPATTAPPSAPPTDGLGSSGNGEGPRDFLPPPPPPKLPRKPGRPRLKK